MTDAPTSTGRTNDGTVFDVWGAAEAIPVVLVHGLGLSRHLWQDHIGAFADAYRVVNYDLYGHGDSAPPPTQASLTVYAEQIRLLLDELSIDRAAIVGFSIGGMINRRFALDHGDRALALCILSSPHDRGTEAQAAVEERAASVRDQGALSTMNAALKRWFTPDFLATDSPYPALVRTWRLEADPESYAQAAWVLAHGVRELTAPSKPIALPTLVMTGEHDSGSTPAMAHAIAGEIAGAETIIVDRHQHLGLVEDPHLITGPVLDFLRRSLA